MLRGLLSRATRGHSRGPDATNGTSQADGSRWKKSTPTAVHERPGLPMPVTTAGRYLNGVTTAVSATR